MPNHYYDKNERKKRTYRTKLSWIRLTTTWTTRSFGMDLSSTARTSWHHLAPEWLYVISIVTITHRKQ